MIMLIILCNQNKSYTKLKTQLVGKIVVTVPKPAYSWTKDGGHACLTGETRRCHHVYTGYKVVEDNGRFKIIESEPTDSLVAIKDEFPYFKEKSYKVVVLGDNKEADYEDGPEIKEPDEELEKLINNK